MNIPIGVLCGLVTLTCWSVGNVFATKAVRKSSAIRVAFLGQTIGLLFLGIAFFAFVGWHALTFREWLLVLSIGGLSIPLFWLYYRSFQVGKLAIVVPISSSYAAITVLLSVLFLHEYLTVVQLIAIACVIVGTVSLAGNWRTKITNKDWLSKGAGYALATAALWGVQFTLVGAAVKTVHWLQATFIAQAVTTIGLGILVLVMKDTKPLKKGVLGNAAVAGITEAAAFLVFNIGAAFDLTSIIAPVAAATPLVTVPLAALMLHEKPTRGQILAAAAIVIGIIILAL